jgi:hypothetical protein
MLDVELKRKKKLFHAKGTDTKEENESKGLGEENTAG